MTAFAALKVSVLIKKNFISKKSNELNERLKTIDTNILIKVNSLNVKSYIAIYKENNKMIALKAPVGLNTRTC